MWSSCAKKEARPEPYESGALKKKVPISFRIDLNLFVYYLFIFYYIAVNFSIPISLSQKFCILFNIKLKI